MIKFYKKWYFWVLFSILFIQGVFFQSLRPKYFSEYVGIIVGAFIIAFIISVILGFIISVLALPFKKKEVC